MTTISSRMRLFLTYYYTCLTASVNRIGFLLRSALTFVVIMRSRNQKKVWATFLSFFNFLVEMKKINNVVLKNEPKKSLVDIT